MRISLIIPTFNRRELLRSLLESLTTDPHIPAHVEQEIIIADDRSTDGTAEMVRKEFPQLKYLVGPGQGPERNKRMAIEICTGDFICNLDDDCVPRHGWMESVVAALDRGEKMVQCKIILHDLGHKELQDESKAHFFCGYRWDMMPVLLNHGGYRPQYIDICHEFGLFVAREILAQVPFNDTNLWSEYGSAAVFYLRAKKLGYRVFFEPQSVIDHWGSTQGGMKQLESKKLVKDNCDEYTSKLIHNFIVIGRMNKFRRLPLVLAYYLAGSVYLSFRQRKNCVKYVWDGIVKGLRRKLTPPIPYANLR